MTTLSTIRRIEEASFNAWPALNTMVYDGWLLRFANGYTKRANSVNGLYAGKLPIETKADYCETIYRQQNLRPIFRLTPLIGPSELDTLLKAQHFIRIDHTSVQLLDLNQTVPHSSERAVILNGSDGVASWLHSFHNLNPQRRDSATHEMMLNSILTALCLMELRVDGELVAAGLAVADGEFVGLFDIVTAAAHRRKGYGLELTSALLAWGLEQDARYTYLQVMTNNEAALKLYDKLGFEEIYDYWYRIAPDNWRSYE